MPGIEAALVASGMLCASTGLHVRRVFQIKRAHNVTALDTRLLTTTPSLLPEYPKKAALITEQRLKTRTTASRSVTGPWRRNARARPLQCTAGLSRTEIALRDRAHKARMYSSEPKSQPRQTHTRRDLGHIHCMILPQSLESAARLR
ncbi:hypothetical protein NDU88_005598 [Pleurodeles waltl]|uniref:Uncharacterized protein n=1 Tax=Pleurodeles waltl TaxID=8319 RepID=A0AAV7L198_PLEWA|nr:hypothetical protein NDU88_005598 [Pleurodeles waltl]